MARKRFTAEQAIIKLRESEVLLPRNTRWSRRRRPNSPRSQALDPSLWSGLQMVLGLA